VHTDIAPTQAHPSYACKKSSLLPGTTAVGKTAFALDFAEQVDAEIVSCDASLFYRGMDIGTAKPSLAEQKRVPHHMLDLCPVDQPYTIVPYVADVRTVIAGIFARGRSVVVTGGSGFYLKSFLYPVTDPVEVSKNIRTQVAEHFSKEGLIGLLRRPRRLQSLMDWEA
jgi:tRNA dimethylallyltransferase